MLEFCSTYRVKDYLLKIFGLAFIVLASMSMTKYWQKIMNTKSCIISRCSHVVQDDEPKPRTHDEIGGQQG